MPTIRERLSASYQAFRDPDKIMALRGADDVAVLSVIVPDDPYERYELLELYKSNTVYDSARVGLLDVAYPEDFSRIRALENPALQVVQFGVMHLFPGPLEEAMPLTGGEGASAALLTAGERILQWSNMAAQKDAIAEDVYTLGDVFLKAVPKEDGRQVYIENRHPGEVSVFREDNLRNIHYLRLDVELEDGQPDGATWWTELWDHEENLYVSWRHKRGRNAKLDTLGDAFEGPKAITNFGHDFVPFVRVPFEAGARPNRLSAGVFERHLVPIDQVNRIATELDELYRENAEGVWATMRGEPGKDPIDLIEDEEEETEEGREEIVHGRRIIRFGGVGRMEDLVPNIDYQVGLNKIEDRRKALERSLAELRYFRGIEGGDPAAAAIAQDRAPAHARARAARGNAEEGVLRALKMCLTMGAKRRLFAGDIGTFERGSFDKLGFKPRPIAPESPTQRAEREEIDARVLRELTELGIPELIERALMDRGFSEADAWRIASDAAKRSLRARVASFVPGGATEDPADPENPEDPENT